MRDRGARRLRLGGLRWRRRRRAGWWQASDGRWYPPSAAWHPAAQREPSAPRVRPPQSLTFVGGMWAILLVPVALAVLLVVAGMANPTPTDTVETFGPGDDDSGDVSGGRSAPGPASTTTTTRASTTTAGGAGPAVGEPAVTPVASGDDPRTSAPPTGTEPIDSTEPRREPPADEPEPPADRPKTPSGADDCRRGGWQHLVDHDGRSFENQGDCVSYLNRLDDD